MRSKGIAPTAVLLFSLIQAVGVAAQSGSADDPAAKGDGAKPAEATVDVSPRPINMDRINRQVRQSTVRDESDGLRLRYVVDVFGQSPRIELFGGMQGALTGPAPSGAPPHQDMLQIMPPQEFSAPAANFGNLFRWLSDKAKSKSDNR